MSDKEIENPNPRLPTDISVEGIVEPWENSFLKHIDFLEKRIAAGGGPEHPRCALVVEELALVRKACAALQEEGKF
jgi:hypothetical protein